MSKRGFDRLAGYYSGLEYIVFAKLLSEARFALLTDLKDIEQVLILGGGSGRLAKRLLKSFPNIKIDFLEQSPKMIELAKTRLSAAELRQLSFYELDVFDFSPTKLYDCIFSPYFLDCFEADQVTEIIAGLSPSLKTNGYWYDVDFNLPEFGFARARAKLYLYILYAFFNLTGALKTRNLVNTEAIFLNNRYSLFKSKMFSRQLLKTSIYKKL